jgi:hypothetical protein
MFLFSFFVVRSGRQRRTPEKTFTDFSPLKTVPGDLAPAVYKCRFDYSSQERLREGEREGERGREKERERGGEA